MKTVNMGSKYTHRVTLRLNEEQYEFLIKVSKIIGVSPSDYLRMTVNAGMVGMKNDIESFANGDALKGMVGTHEDVETDSNHIV